MAEPARRRDTMDVRISPVGLDGILGLPGRPRPGASFCSHTAAAAVA